MNNYRVCEPVRIAQCDNGFYYNGATCVACQPGCLSCSAATCLRCNDGFYPSGQVCQPRCGDGIAVGNEQCDDGNLNNNDGCSVTCVK